MKDKLLRYLGTRGRTAKEIAVHLFDDLEVMEKTKIGYAYKLLYVLEDEQLVRRGDSTGKRSKGGAIRWYRA